MPTVEAVFKIEKQIPIRPQAMNELHGGIHRRRPRYLENHFLFPSSWRDLDEHLRQPRGRNLPLLAGNGNGGAVMFVIRQHAGKLFRGFRNRLNNERVRVADVGHANLAREVHVCLPRRVPNRGALGAHCCRQVITDGAWRNRRSVPLPITCVTHDLSLVGNTPSTHSTRSRSP